MAPAPSRQDQSKQGERRQPAPQRPRQEPGHPRQRQDQAPQHRPPQEPRRKRGEHRATSWGDGIDRAWCTRALHPLPETFPVQSQPGAATIAPVIVDRREQMALLCDFSHSGDHAWPEVMFVISGGEGDPEDS